MILTPLDLLTRDDTWINHKDMIRNFARLPAAVPNDQLRAQINAYFRRRLGNDPDAKRKREAAAETVQRFPELIDRYIRMQEDEGDRAESISAEKVEEAKRVLVEQVRLAVIDLERNTKFTTSRGRAMRSVLSEQDTSRHTSRIETASSALLSPG